MTSRLSSWWQKLTGAPASPPRPMKPPIFGGQAAADAPPPPAPVGPEGPTPSTGGPLKFVANPELEARLDASPDDEHAWAIYGDWLQTAGDGRGELVALMAKGLDADAAAYVTRNHDALFGAAAPFTPWLKSKRTPAPFVRYAPPRGPADPIHRIRTEASDHGIRDVQWHRGFVARASIHPGRGGLPEKLLALPICRFLRELGIGHVAHDTGPYGALLEAIDAGPPSLTRLVLGDFVYPDECEMSWAELDGIEGVWSLKRLEALVICGGTAELGKIDGAHLRAFSRETGALRGEELSAIFEAKWPRLERLELWLGSDEYGGEANAIEALDPLLKDPGRFPSVVHLGLKNSVLGDDLPGALAASPLLPRLTALELSMGTMGDGGAEALVRHAAQFRHLKHLDLSDNYLTAACHDALKAALPMVAGLDDQPRSDDADDPADRYVSVSE